MFETKIVDKLAFFIGCAVIILVFKRTIDYLILVLKSYILPCIGLSKNLKDYGEWAVVTGATDGIGKEYAKQLAKIRFNIVLISRSNTKLQVVAEELKKLYKVEVRVLVFDFAQQYGYERMEEALENLDVGILVNNVGMTYEQNISFHDANMETIVDIINVNMISLVKMTRMILRGMLERERGAVIHISSGSIYLTAPFCSIYPATKLFVSKFVKSLQLENANSIDHQIVTPFLIESKLSKARPSLAVPTAEQYVSSAIKTIGITNMTCGCLIHEVFASVLQWIPPAILMPLIVKSRAYRYKNE